MKIPVILRQALFGTLCAQVLAACGPQDTGDEPLVIEVDEAVAIYVNGEPVTLGEVQLAAIAEGVIEPGRILTAKHPEFERLLGQITDQKLLAQEAVRLELDQQPSAKDRLDYARISILRDVFTESLVSEAEIERMYAEQVELQQLDDEVKISQILTETEEEAFDVFQALSEGEDFASLAFEHSIDTRSRINGGSLGYIKPNDLPEPFPAVIGNTAIGAIADVFETDNGWHVLRVDDRRQEAPMTLEEMRPAILKFLVEQQLKDTILKLRSRADIEVPNRGRRPEISQETNAAEVER